MFTQQIAGLNKLQEFLTPTVAIAGIDPQGFVKQLENVIANCTAPLEHNGPVLFAAPGPAISGDGTRQGGGIVAINGGRLGEGSYGNYAGAYPLFAASGPNPTSAQFYVSPDDPTTEHINGGFTFQNGSVNFLTNRPGGVDRFTTDMFALFLAQANFQSPVQFAEASPYGSLSPATARIQLTSKVTDYDSGTPSLGGSATATIHGWNGTPGVAVSADGTITVYDKYGLFRDVPSGAQGYAAWFWDSRKWEIVRIYDEIYFHARRSVEVTHTGVDQQITFDTLTYQRGGHALSGGDISIGAAGVYIITAEIATRSLSAGIPVDYQMKKNGSIVTGLYATWKSQDVSEISSIVLTGIAEFAVGDLLRMIADSSSSTVSQPLGLFARRIATIP